jgi:hypothetical protein
MQNFMQEGEAHSHGDMNRWSVSNVSQAFPSDIFMLLGPTELSPPIVG